MTLYEIKTNEKHPIDFNLQIHGVDYKKLKGSIIFTVENVEYGFPVATIKQDYISANIPPLDDIIKKGLEHGKEIKCELSLYGDGFHINPWSGIFKLIKPATVEATINFSNNKRISEDMNIITESNYKTKRNKNITTETKEVIEDTITEGDESKQLLQMLEKFLKNEKNKNELLEINDDEEKGVNDEETISLITKNKTKTKKDIKNYDKGIMGKKGKRNILVEPPEKQPNSKIKEAEKILNKLLKRNVYKKNTTESKKSKKHINIEVLKEKLWKSKQYKKIKKLNESKKQRGNNITNKNKIDSKKSLKHIDENNITKQNIHTLLESYGMTTDNSKNIMIDRASELSELKDNNSIFKIIKSMLEPNNNSTSGINQQNNMDVLKFYENKYKNQN